MQGLSMLELSCVRLSLRGVIPEREHPCVGLSMCGVIQACSSHPVPVEELVLARAGPGL